MSNDPPQDSYNPLPDESTSLQELEKLELSIKETSHLFSLPLSTHELGLLPIYQSFDYPHNTSHQSSWSPPNIEEPEHWQLPLNAEQMEFDQERTAAAAFRFVILPFAWSGLVEYVHSWQDWSMFADQEHYSEDFTNF